jgi:hypothetical protein
MCVVSQDISAEACICLRIARERLAMPRSARVTGETASADTRGPWRTGLHRAGISSSARLATYCQRRASTSPQLATREYVEKRHQRDQTEHGPCQLRAPADIPAGGQVNPHQDHGNRMEEADQEFEDLLHRLNLPGPLWVPDRSLPAARNPRRPLRAPSCVSVSFTVTPAGSVRDCVVCLSWSWRAGRCGWWR